MPTGTAIRDVREQLFGAAERVLLRAGPNALTSRAVTDEAGVAKGVLHRHFADFDGFLTELVLDRITRLDALDTELQASVGTSAVVDVLTRGFAELFGPLAVAIVGLIIARDELRTRLRAAGTARIPIIGEATAHFTSYLAAERDLGRIAADADVATLARTLMGAVHLAFTELDGTGQDGTGQDGGPVDPAALRKVVATVMAGVRP